MFCLSMYDIAKIYISFRLLYAPTQNKGRCNVSKINRAVQYVRPMRATVHHFVVHHNRPYPFFN